MPVCVPIKDMRDTAKFSELVESTPGPITVTKNGYSKFVVMRSVDYDRMVQEQAKARLIERVVIAERERAAGLGRSAFEALSDLETKYSL